MATSVFGWLDHDDGERRQMMEIINLFREKGTLDELGLGTIRDTFAEHFFPGTSTIQTRARYFLFIPWLYQIIEAERVPSQRVDEYARDLHWRLVQSLKAGGEGASAGVIGIEAGRNLQRLPSAIYWQGLRRWGIRQFDHSDERYRVSLDGSSREERAAKRSEGDELIASARCNWHGALPDRPENLLESTTFVLTLDEAEFLHERVRHTCGGSLLAACLTPRVTGKRRARAPWELGRLDSLSPALQQDIAQAGHFSLVMEGATLLYNRMLAELSVDRGLASNSARVDRYGDALERWADEMSGSRDQLRDWDRSAFWGRVQTINPRIRSGAVTFSDTWLQRAISDPGSVVDDDTMRSLIRSRERRLKGGLARLSNPRALEKWSGESGLGRLTYRWASAQRIVLDIVDGLERARETA